ncbi:hypothetical protein [Chryseobacterium camelliae]|uniref:hypothetical protein n=1 Tax=Chryseobacterium camelliae TaxID=1265445 RepID=UPI0028640310|nr:hypothetical protein [Chryseobacterium camelliae]MDR6514446.1 hypothetical protein [Chryseobacterium camelliae]
MKKLFFLSMLCCAAYSFAQVTPKFVYAEIVGESRLFSTKVTVSIDYGQSTSFFENTKVKNEDGSNRKFNSMVDAMNYMGALGWEFQQAYVVTSSQQNVYHWLMRKNFTDLPGDIQEEMKKNFPTKKDL